MNKPVSVAALKKALKTATVKVEVNFPSFSEYATAVVTLTSPTLENELKFVGQACRRMDSSEDAKSEYSRFNFNPSDRVHGVASGWYGLNPTDCRPSLRGYELERAIVSLQTWLNFTKIINEHADHRNLALVHKNCDLSIILTSLRDLGAYVQFTVNGVDRWEYNRNAAEKQQNLLTQSA